MEAHIYSVTELNQKVKSLIDGAPDLRSVYVQGELSNYVMHQTGHHFFNLKDQGGVLKCIMYAPHASKLRFKPVNGMKVILRGGLSVFPKTGIYQLYCDSMTPEGAGDLAVAFEQLKEKLRAEGLFEQDHKKPLPRFPEKIAIVTSPVGDAVRDITHVLRRRYPLAKVILLPVQVQGDRAPLEIAGALRYADKWKIGDVIITGRGGGSMEDLWAFNDERVARTIYALETPVITAVGHEPDVTISDFVSDASAFTPTHAAQMAVPNQVELLRWLRGAEDRMEQIESARLAALRQRLEAAASKRVIRDHMAYVQDKRMGLIHLQQRLGDLSTGLLERKKARYAALAAALDAMSPLKVLGRGYAMVQGPEGGILKSSRDVSAGDRVTVTLGEGALRCTVDGTVEREEA
ncbi:MAG: exodeoxyribonuclease VII large subunit [Oscillibacter sp.]|nr:exodeoxyribonuclease VII large subunit [Oscillibacter sp.]